MVLTSDLTAALSATNLLEMLNTPISNMTIFAKATFESNGNIVTSKITGNNGKNTADKVSFFIAS